MAENKNFDNTEDFKNEAGNGQPTNNGYGMVCGGYPEVMEITEDLKNLVLSLLPKIETHTGRNFETFEPISFTFQIVNGTIYVVKVHIGNGEHIRVAIFKPLDSEGQEIEVKWVNLEG